MKKIFLRTIFFLTIAGCGKETYTEEKPNTDFYVPLGSIASKDSINYYESYSQNDKLILAKRHQNNNEIIWKCKIETPSPITIDLGYGDHSVFEAQKAIPLIDTNEFILVQWNFLDTKNYHSYNILQTYSVKDGTFISEFSLESTLTATNSPIRWLDDSLIIPYTTPQSYNYIIINKTGKTSIIKEDVQLESFRDPLCRWEKGYASIETYNNTFIACYLDYGTKTCYLNPIFEEMYPQENNSPKIDKISSITRNEESFNISIVLLFYDGNMEDVEIQITDEMLQNY